MANQANYNNGVFSVTQSGSYSGSQNYLTDVGAFTNSGSSYGTFDQSGNVDQWNDLDGTPGSSRGLRGGDWNDVFAFDVSSSFSGSFDPSDEDGPPRFSSRKSGQRLRRPRDRPERSECSVGVDRRWTWVTGTTTVRPLTVPFWLLSFIPLMPLIPLSPLLAA